MKNTLNQKLHSISFIFVAFSLLLISCQNTEINSGKFDLEKLNQIDNLINTSIDLNSLPGAVVLVAKNNKIVYKKAFGIKNPTTGEKYKTDDIFRIASMTKAITSLGVMKLWEKGLFGLDVPL